MRITSIALLFIAGLVLSSCEKPIPDGFACVKPIPGKELKKAQLDISAYQETPSGSGKYVPKGWHVVPDGPYRGCYVPYQPHDTKSTYPPTQ
jgi:hypothetical protein